IAGSEDAHAIVVDDLGPAESQGVGPERRAVHYSRAFRAEIHPERRAAAQAVRRRRDQEHRNGSAPDARDRLRRSNREHDAGGGGRELGAQAAAGPRGNCVPSGQHAVSQQWPTSPADGSAGELIGAGWPWSLGTLSGATTSSADRNPCWAAARTRSFG